METSPQQARAILGAMLNVAEAGSSGTASERDVATIAGARLHALGGADFTEVDALARTSPASLASQLRVAGLREYAERFLMVMAFVEGRVDAQKLLLVGDYAASLDLDDTFLESTYWAARHQFRFVATYLLGAQMAGIREGAWIISVLATLFPAYAGEPDPDLRARYLRLGGLPEESLGHAVYEHHRINGLAFPGEPRSVGEQFGTPHDVTHVIGDFALSPGDELCAAAFSAGMSGQAADDTILAVLFGYRLGILDFARYGRTSFDGRRFWGAYRRGCATTTDFFDDGFHFWDVVDEPVDALRDKYSVGVSGNEASLAIP